MPVLMCLEVFGSNQTCTKWIPVQQLAEIWGTSELTINYFTECVHEHVTHVMHYIYVKKQ